MNKVDDVTKLIKNVDINSVIPDKANPNVMTDEELKRLEKSLETYGFIYPILVDQNNIVVDGHHRLKIYKSKGMKKVPVIQMNLESEAQRKLLRQVVTKLHGSPDLEKELKELEVIIKEDKENLNNLLGIDDEYIEDLKNSINLSEPHFRHPKENVEDVMKDLNLKKVIHIPVTDEIIKAVKSYMDRNNIENYEELFETIEWETL